MSKKSKKKNRISRLVAEMVEGFKEFCYVLESGQPIENKFPVSTVKYDRESVKGTITWID